MKKGKVISMPTSPDAQIRTRARNLPLDKCFINTNWEKTQMATIIVSRKHINRKLTFGFYLVDLNLLGVKDCFYAFNKPQYEMEEFISSQSIEFEECDYALVHNIMFKSIAFAKYYGFEPAKDFTKTGIFILEENNENIPSMEIPLGKDGIPVVFTGHGRNSQHEINILKKTAGMGNFIIYNLDDLDTKLFDDDDDDDDFDEDEDDFEDEDFDDEDFDEEDFDDEEFDDEDFDDVDSDDEDFKEEDFDDEDFDDEDFDDEDFDDEDFDDEDFDVDNDEEDLSYDDIIDEIEELGVREYLIQYGKDLTIMQILALTDYAYIDEFDVDIYKEDHVIDLILDDERYDPALDSPFELERYSESLQSVANKLVDDVDAAALEMEKLITEHSDDPELAFFNINMLRDLDLRSELEHLTLVWYDRLPDHYTMRLLYAEWLIEMERFDEVFKLFDNLPGLDALTTENKPFTDVMISEFCACYVMAWLSKNNIEKAEPYYQILIILEAWTPFVMNALMEMLTKKKEAIIGNADQEDHKDD